jgi:hypothetical protein
MASKKTARALQLLFLVLLVAAAVRLIVVMRQRAEPGRVLVAVTVTPRPLNREAYVVPKKLHISSLKSAAQLTQQPVWVKEGYRYTVYPYASRTADFKHPAGMLLPLQKIQIKDVATAAAPGDKNRTVLAIFDQDGKTYAVPIGLESGSDVTFYADEMFFYEDPRELYNFWTAETWDAIGRHEVTNGMNEYQAAFAVGMGIPEPGDSSSKTVKYPNGGKPMIVTFQKGRAIDIKPGN